MNKLLKIRSVCEILNCSPMTVHRRLKEPNSKFPKPTIINKVRHWGSTEMSSYVEDRLRERNDQGAAA